MNHQILDQYQANIEDYIDIHVEDRQNTVGVGNAFCKWVLINYCNLTESEAEDAMDMAGSGDYGIDALVENYNGNKLLVVQSKYGSSHSYEAMSSFAYNTEKYLLKEITSHKINPNAQRALVKIQDYTNDDVEFMYITNQQMDSNEIKRLMRKDVAKISFLGINEIGELLDSRGTDIPVSIQNWFEISLSKDKLILGEKTMVVAISLLALYELVDKGGNALYASNVRQYLRNTKINRKIADTVLKEPDKFLLYNNGITIVCEDFYEVTNYKLNVKTPQIVNGCQTARTIWDVISRKPSHERQSINGYVLVRLIKGASKDEKEQITRSTNTQNAVRGKDFFSLEGFQQRLQKRMAKSGYYYEIQRGAYASLKNSERAKYKGKAALRYLTGEKFNFCIPALEAIQSYAAGFHQISAVSYGRPYELAPGEHWHDEVITNELEPTPEFFLYPFLIREWARKSNYSRSGTSWRAHSLFLFVETYFGIIAEILKRTNKVPSEQNLKLTQIDIKHFTNILENKDVNLDILQLTDDTLERFFEDSNVEAAVSNDVRKFLKNKDVLDKYHSILTKKINLLLDKKQEFLIQVNNLL